MTDWNIQSRAHACEACGKSFADKETYHTLLCDERGVFRRSDICQTCWQQQHSEGSRERKGFVSYWTGVFEIPPPPTETIRKETAESLLRKIIEIDDERFASAAYILAAMLERKRILKVKEQLIRDGKRIFIYEHPKSGDVFTVSDPALQLSQLEAVQRDVAELLEHGLPEPGQPSPEGVTPGTNSGTEPTVEPLEPSPVLDGVAASAPDGQEPDSKPTGT